MKIVKISGEFVQDMHDQNHDPRNHIGIEAVMDLVKLLLLRTTKREYT